MNALRPMLVIAVLVATPAAHAGTYLSLGIGTDASLSGQFADHFAGAGGSGQLALGHRFRNLAIEGSLAGSRLDGTSSSVQDSDYSSISLGLELKYFMSISGRFEGYFKAGLQRNWLADTDARSVDASGIGYRAGAGLQYSLRMPAVADGAIWLEIAHQELYLRGTKLPELDGSARTVILGLSFGL